MLKEYTRNCNSNQKLFFDIANGYLVTGSTNNELICHNIEFDVSPEIITTEDVINCVSFHPFYPLLATTSGKRNYLMDSDYDDFKSIKNGLQVWSLKNDSAWNSYKNYYQTST